MNTNPLDPFQPPPFPRLQPALESLLGCGAYWATICAVDEIDLHYADATLLMTGVTGGVSYDLMTLAGRAQRGECFEASVQITLSTPPGGSGERLFGPIRCTYWVRPASAERVRLLAKLRLAPPQRVLSRLAHFVLAWGDLVMMRRRLLNLKALAESR